MQVQATFLMKMIDKIYLILFLLLRENRLLVGNVGALDGTKKKVTYAICTLSTTVDTR